MFRYFFVLGRSYDLCKAELLALLHAFSITVLDDIKPVIVVSSSREIPLQLLCDRAGGLIKAGEIKGADLSLADAYDTTVEHASSHFLSRKFKFGLSFYGNLSKTVKVRESVTQLGSRFDNLALHSSYVFPEYNELSSVQIDKYKLLGDRGADYVFVGGHDRCYVGVTSAIQPFSTWSSIDYGRPQRDSKSGMLPPKVARMMIHIGIHQFILQNPGWTKPIVVCDPFCGSGTVLTEAVRLGCKVVGSDISEKAVADTRANLDWISESSLYTIASDSIDPFFGYVHARAQKGEARVFVQDVAHIGKSMSDRVDLIITEPYLGPPFEAEPTPGKIERIVKGLQKMYIGAFSSLKNILTKNGVFVFAEPEYLGRNKTYTVGIIDNSQRYGYTLKSKIVEYKRDKSFVGRRIGILVQL